MMNLKKLNGWQRLWVVLSAAWLVIVVIMAGGDTLSTTAKLSDQLETEKADTTELWAEYTIKLVWANPNVRAKSPFGFVPDVESVRQKYSELDDVEFAERYQRDYPEVNFAQINAEVEKTIQRLGSEHRQAREKIVLENSVFALLVWIVPSALAYVFALGVGWVWRGFKLKGESNE